MRVPGAATARVRDLLGGPDAVGEVVHRGRDAAYVAVAGHCLGVLARNAVHVPCGLLTTLPALGGLAGPGDRVRIHDGILVVGEVAVTVARLVPSALPRIDDPVRARADLRPVLASATDEVATELPATALRALGRGEPASVGDLLGRGSGLTPLGDDVLSGWLAAAAATRLTVAAGVRREVSTLASRRTTLLSAELLDCAVAGEVVPQLRELLTALATGRSPAPAAGRLLRIGHTSGAGLALGCLLALTPREGSPA